MGAPGEGPEGGDIGSTNPGRGTPSQIENPSTPDPIGRVQASGLQNPNGSAAPSNPVGSLASVPVDPKDLAAVEWSYKDPSGNIQGTTVIDVYRSSFSAH